jgi:hypothetical protein
MEIGIVSSHLIWLYRTRHDHRAARTAGKSYDDYIKSLELPTEKPDSDIDNSSPRSSLTLATEMSYDDGATGRSDYTSTPYHSRECLHGVQIQYPRNECSLGYGQSLTFSGVPNTSLSEPYLAVNEGDVGVTIPPPVHVRTGDRIENRRTELEEMV